ncbi:pyocin knob domain-containing protein [Furfurilactobacillus sp. WILCCON 0119]
MASKFKPTIVTQEYVNALNASVVSGQPVIITKAIASNTPLSDAQASSLTAEQAKTVVVNQTAELKGAVRIDADASQLLVRARLSNEAITSDYQLNSLLLYGTYAGKDILVAVTRTVSPEIMPAYDETSPVAIEVNIYLKAIAQGDATVQVATAGLATMEAVNDVREYVDGPFDAKLVHLAGSETISGDKTFTKPVKATGGVVGDVIGNVTGRADLATEAVHAAATDHAKVSDQATEAIHAGKTDEATHATNADQATHANAADIATKLSHLISVNDQTVDTSNGVANVIKSDPQVHELVVNGDFNNYTTAGLWKNALTVNVKSMANHPGDGVAGTLVVLETAGVVQLFIEYVDANAVSNSIWKRGCYNGKWSPWVKQAADDNKLVHNTGNEVITGSKTFSQNVVGGLATREFPKGVKLADVATAMDQYNGNWFVRGDNVPSDLPPQLENWFTVSVTAGNSPTTGMILLNGFANNIRVITTVNNQMISGWQKLPDDAAVMHKGDTANPTMNVLAANSDFNSYTTGGVWQNANSGPIKTMANYPGDGVAGALVVLETAGPVQIFIEYIDANVTTGNGSIWKRGCYYGKWSPWMKQAADDNKLVHNTGNETIVGVKTFAQQLKANGGVTADGNLDLSAGSHKLSLNNNGQLMLDQRQIANQEYGNLSTIDLPDFNALLTPGNYSLTHPSGGKNGPDSTSWGRLEVRIVGNATNQRFINDTGGLIYTRTYYSGAWSPWVETVTDDASVVHRTGTETIAGPKTFTSPLNATGLNIGSLSVNGQAVSYSSGSNNAKLDLLEFAKNDRVIQPAYTLPSAEWKVPQAPVLIQRPSLTNLGHGMATIFGVLDRPNHDQPAWTEWDVLTLKGCPSPHFGQIGMIFGNNGFICPCYLFGQSNGDLILHVSSKDNVLNSYRWFQINYDY